MTGHSRCQQCDTPLTGQAVGGLCANCLLKLALEPPGELTAPVEEPAGEGFREVAGSRIGNYTLLEQIGQGGFGTVWMAEQSEPVQRRVALKIIRIGMDTREFIARFEQERQALAMMDHPNIAKVFDAGATDSGRPFFVMELVAGVPITKFCDEQKLPLPARLELFIDVCRAIQHAHQKGVIHRDIKPSNVMVSGDGLEPSSGPSAVENRRHVKVIDFGIAKATQGKLTDETVVTRFEQFIGTPVYMSPEQAGMVPDIDTRSDIYALGVLLYELLTGKPPFDAKSLGSAGYEEMRRIIREVDPPKPSTRRTQLLNAAASEKHPAKAQIFPLKSSIEPDLDWIVMKAIDKDRARRYETVSGLALDLQRFLSDEPVSATPPSAAYRFRKFARRNRTALLAGAGMAAVLVAATAVSVWQAVRATAAGKVATGARELANARLVEVVAERDQKDQARKDAEEISTLLGEVFQSPDPSRDGREIKVEELLAKAVKKLETDLASQPARRSGLQSILGRTYQAIGLPREAITLQEKVRDYYLANLGPEHIKTLMALGNLANSYHSTGRQEEALKMREGVLPLIRKFGLEHPATLMAMGNLAGSYSFAGRHEEALPLGEEVFALFRKLSGPEHPDTLKAIGNLAIYYENNGRAEEARKMKEELLALSRKVYGLEHPDTLTAMRNLANTYHNSAGRLEDALKLLEDVLPLSRKVNGPGHPDTQDAMTGLIKSYECASRPAEAIKLSEELLPLISKLKGPEHPKTIAAMAALATHYYHAGRRKSAHRMREDVLVLSREVNGPEHPETLRLMTSLAVSRGAAGRLPEAIELQEQALAIMRRVLRSNDPALGFGLVTMGDLYEKDGRKEVALKTREDALSLYLTARGPEHTDTANVMQDLATSYHDAGRMDEALKMREEVLALYRKKPGPENSETIRTMHALATSYARTGRVEQGLKMREEVLEYYRKVKRPEHPDTLGAMTNLATSYADAGRLPEAIKLQEQSLAIKRRVLPPNHNHLKVALRNMADFYERDGRKEEAAALRKELADKENP